MTKRPVPDLERRRRATQATLDKFRGRVFDWSSGVTCVHLARFHLRAMGHKVERLPSLRSAISARRELKKHGWHDCHDMLAGQPGLIQIAPAAMLMGDLAVLRDQDGLGAIFICAGPHMVFGWREDAPELVCLRVDLAELSGAFRG